MSSYPIIWLNGYLHFMQA